MIPQEKWQWFGSPAHFCCASWCRFHLATKVGKYLISTVGEYVPPRNSGGGEQTEAKWLMENWPGENIGFNRKYETMVFRAGKVCRKTGCKCGLPMIGSDELTCLGANQAGQAARNHMNLCREYARKPKENRP